jgi:hypothetical protein
MLIGPRVMSREGATDVVGALVDGAAELVFGAAELVFGAVGLGV